MTVFTHLLALAGGFGERLRSALANGSWLDDIAAISILGDVRYLFFTLKLEKVSL